MATKGAENQISAPPYSQLDLLLSETKILKATFKPWLHIGETWRGQTLPVLIGWKPSEISQ